MCMSVFPACMLCPTFMWWRQERELGPLEWELHTDSSKESGGVGDLTQVVFARAASAINC